MRTKSFSIFQAPLPRQMKLPDLPAILQPPRTTRTPRHVLWGQRQQKSSNTEHQRPAFIAKANIEICDQVFQRAQQLEGFVECLSVNTKQWELQGAPLEIWPGSKNWPWVSLKMLSCMIPGEIERPTAQKAKVLQLQIEGVFSHFKLDFRFLPIHQK